LYLVHLSKKEYHNRVNLLLYRQITSDSEEDSDTEYMSNRPGYFEEQDEIKKR